MELEQEIKKMIKEEVDKQMQYVNNVVVAVNDFMTKMVGDFDAMNKVFVETTSDIKAWMQMNQKMPVTTKPVIAVMPTIKKTTPAPSEEPEEDNNGPDMIELAWIKEQDGNIEKGETQIWRYGNHTLTVWMDGKKYLTQIDDEEPTELWNQKALEKIQKKIEKMPQE